jgi:hypothetical protein
MNVISTAGTIYCRCSTNARNASNILFSRAHSAGCASVKRDLFCLVPAFSKIRDTVAVIHGIMYGETLVGNEDPEVIGVT